MISQAVLQIRNTLQDSNKEQLVLWPKSVQAQEKTMSSDIFQGVKKHLRSPLFSSGPETLPDSALSLLHNRPLLPVLHLQKTGIYTHLNTDPVPVGVLPPKE